MWRLRTCLKTSEARTLVSAFILSRARYCLPIYRAGATLDHFDKVRVAYKSSLRLVVNTTDRRFPSSELYELSGLPSLDAVAKEMLACMVHRIVFDKAPPYLRQLFKTQRAFATRFTEGLSTVPAHRYQGCRGNGNSHGNSHSHGNGNGNEVHSHGNGGNGNGNGNELSFPYSHGNRLNIGIITT